MIDSAAIMKIQGFVTGAYRENAWFVDCGLGEAVLIDPGAEAPRLLGAVREAGCSLKAVLLTHGHLDHISALPEMLFEESVPIHIGPGDAVWCFTEQNDLPPYKPVLSPPETLVQDLVDGAVFKFGDTEFQILSTPGHSPGSVCFLLGGPAGSPAVLFAGDTLFAGSIGRTDFEGGDDAAMAASLRRLAALPAETRVLPGHGPATTIARELRTNPYLLAATAR